MQNKFPLAMIALAGGFSLTVAAVQAQQQNGGHPSEPDLAGMAQDLGVTKSALEGCFGARPERGQRPERPDAGKIASCLARSDSSVTEAKVDKVLRTHAPQGGRG